MREKAQSAMVLRGGGAGASGFRSYGLLYREYVFRGILLPRKWLSQAESRDGYVLVMPELLKWHCCPTLGTSSGFSASIVRRILIYGHSV